MLAGFFSLAASCWSSMKLDHLVVGAANLLTSSLIELRSPVMVTTIGLVGAAVLDQLERALRHDAVDGVGRRREGDAVDGALGVRGVLGVGRRERDAGAAGQAVGDGEAVGRAGLLAGQGQLEVAAVLDHRRR